MSDHDPFEAFLGKGSHFEGKLSFEGEIRIDGAFVGEIFAGDTIVVGEGADVQAEIDVSVVVIRGKVTGNIRASKSIEMKAPGEMRGNIDTPTLQIDKGVFFEGACRMTGNGKGAARTIPASTLAPQAPADAIDLQFDEETP